MTFKFLAAAAALLAMPVSAAAQDWDDLDARMCRNGLFGDDAPFQLARIAGEGRAYFLDDMDGCPEAGECRSFNNPYVVPGDVVVISKLRTDHACAYFPNDSGGTAGYLPIERLEVVPVGPMPARQEWLGDWSHGGNPALSITIMGNDLFISGSAFWPGRPGTHDYHSTNIGEVQGQLTILGHRARFDDGECVLDLTLLGDVLVVGDNRRCGGMNVTFSDVYRREAV